MRRAFLSFDPSTEPWLDEIVAHTERLGLGISGRHVPVGRSGELIPDVGQQLEASAVALVVFGDSDPDQTVIQEIEWSQDFDIGIVAIRVAPDSEIPVDLYEAGAEILDWSLPADRERLSGAIKAATLGARLMERARRGGSGAGAACARPPRRRD
jgi:hypothetical protein